LGGNSGGSRGWGVGRGGGSGALKTILFIIHICEKQRVYKILDITIAQKSAILRFSHVTSFNVDHS
jgi:hypothetical protein